MTKKLFLLTLALVILVGCTSKREEEFAQGMGQQDLWSISDFQKKFYTVNTHGTLIKKSATAADNLKLATGDDSYDQLNNFNLVSYTTDCNLLNDVPFRGRENSTYKVRYVINKDYLIVMKAASQEFLPSQERIVAKPIPGTDLFEVPLIGYPISLINVENIEDANGDKMSKVAEYRAIDLGGASHFKIDLTNRQLFTHDEKNDVFPEEIFDGEWYYAATVVSANTEQSDLVGRDLSEDQEQAYVSRINFKKTVNSIIGRNVNMDKNIDADDEINAVVAIEIPVEWVDYRIAKVGKDAVLREEELGDGHAEAKLWEERQFMKIDFAQAKAGFSMNAYNEVLNPKFQNLEITTNYFSFTIYYPDAGIRVKYAFKKAPSTEDTRDGRVYFKEDRTVFGYFLTNKHFIPNYRYFYRDDFDREVLLNKFYPESNNNMIEYRFTHTTPEEFRPAAKKVVEEWNKIFKEAGTGYTVTINDDPGADVDLGDLRYNIMNIVDTKDGAGLLGYGPSIADTKSGEIISATTNVYINPFRDTIAWHLRNYIRYRLGMIEVDQVGNAPASDNGTDVAMMMSVYDDFMKSVSGEMKDMIALSKSTYVEDHKKDVEAFHKHQEKIYNNKTHEHFSVQHYGQKCSYQAHSGEILERIERDCKDDFLPYVADLIKKGITHDEREIDVIESCTKKLIGEDLIATLIHEMGHNFGLRHNFVASNDPANFYDIGETNGVLVKSSSTMDYANGMAYELLKPGLYDLAAIRFAYADTIEDVDGNFHKLDVDKTIADNISDLRISPRKFRYCTDEHVGDKDPLCTRHDFGENPLEVVESTINYYHSLVATNGYRYDKAYGPLQIKFNSRVLERVLVPLKRIYEHWRFLLTEHVGESKKNLEMYNAQDFNQLLEKMKNDQGKAGRDYAQYYEASQKAYEFLRDIVSSTAKYCVVKNNSNDVEDYEYFEFEELRLKVYSHNDMRVTIFDCDDPAALTYYADTDVSLIRKVGSYYNGVTQSLDPYHETETVYYRNPSTGQVEPHERLEITGSNYTRDMAMFILSFREPLLNHGKKVENNANFIDDPRYRGEVLSLLINQVLYGTSTIDLGTGDLEQRRVPLFKIDIDTKVNSFMQLLNGLQLPVNQNATLIRWGQLKPLVVSVANEASIPKEAAKTQVDSVFYYATKDRAIAYDMIVRLKGLLYLSEQPKLQIVVPTKKQIFPKITALPLISREAFTQMTLAQFRDAVFAIRDAVNTFTDENEKMVVQFILEQEMNFAATFTQYATQIEPMLQMNALEVIQTQMKIPLETLYCFSDVIEQRVENWIEVQTKLVDFRENQIEYEAQINMLRTIFMAITQNSR